MKNTFHLVTVVDGNSDAAAILDVASRMAQGTLKCDLKVLNYYDEMPVCYGSTITNVENDSIELEVHEQQALIIMRDKSTILKSSHFHHELGVHCYASYVNVKKKIVILNNFAYAQIRAERREAVRVAVRETLPVTFSIDNAAIDGRIVDISGNGLSIICGSSPVIETNQSGVLRFTVAGTPLAVPGSIVRSVTDGNGGYICMFHIKPDRKSESTLGQFIFQRQVELIQELKNGVIENP